MSNNNSLDLGGASLKDAGRTGDERNDITTKRYVDRWFFPVDQPSQHYQRYINARDYLMHPLTGLCMTSTNLSVNGYINTILEAMAYHETFYFHTQSVKDKYIQVNYLNSVKVNSWVLIITAKTPITATFKWQASDDNEKTWVDICNARVRSSGAPPSTKAISINKGQWNFEREDMTNKKQYSCWRLMGISGQISDPPFVNVMLMYLD